ncbi:MAG: amidohydrolase family protein [Alphaproteobacteria bacterium]|nr:amidohydrolase family protein [Alphaproteobacteria bacterium]
MAYIKPDPRNPPRLKAPRGSVDTHIHIYGPKEQYPWAPTRMNDPPLATADDYRRTMDWIGIERCIVVQPSHYAKDNRCTMDAVKSLGRNNARAIVVVDETAPEAELARLTKEGACGIRFHMMPGGVLPWDLLETMAPRVHAHGWHVQLQCNGRNLPEREALLRRLPCPIVVDHVGRFVDPVPVGDPAFKCLLGLIDTGRVWVKNSAPYESSKTGGPAFADVTPLAKALIRHAPERMLWASNWPHPGRDGFSDAAMLDLLLDWAPDDKTRRMMLVDNPAKLYGFA